MRATLLLLLALILTALLVACGTEDADLFPPAFTLSPASMNLLNRPSNAATVVLSGTLDDPAATVEVEINGSAAPAAFVLAADGSWTLSFTPVEGTNSVSLTASDLRGNINQLAFGLVHDTTLPTVTAHVPTQDATLAAAVDTISITFSEALAENVPVAADFLIDNVAIAATNFAYDPATRIATLTAVPALGNGSHSVSIGVSGAIVDPAGNPLAPKTINFTVAIP